MIHSIDLVVINLHCYSKEEVIDKDMWQTMFKIFFRILASAMYSTFITFYFDLGFP